MYACYIIIYTHNIGYNEVHIDAAYVNLKQPTEKALRMLSTQNIFELRSKFQTVKCECISFKGGSFINISNKSETELAFIPS